MKPIHFTLTLILLVPLLGFAQKKEKDKAILELTKSTCDCTKEKNLVEMSRQQMELELGVCILNAINSNKKAKKVLNIDLSNSDGMGELGEQIGLKMVDVCPNEIMAIGLVALEEEDMEEYVEDSEPGYSMDYEISGTLTAVEEGQFSHLVIEGDNGTRFKLIWLGYFEGSDILINAPEKAVGKKVTAKYYYVECYSPQKKEYYDEMQISFIQFLE